MSDMRNAIEAAAEGIYMMSPWRKNTYDNQTYSWAEIAEDHETFIEEATAAIDAAAPILAEAHEPRTIDDVGQMKALKMADLVLAHNGTPRHRLFEYPHRDDDSRRMIQEAEAVVSAILTVLHEPAQ